MNKQSNEKTVKPAWGSSRIIMALSGLVVICLGIVVLSAPAISFAYLFFFGALVHGAAKILGYIFGKGGRRSGWDLLNGFAFLIFGIFMVTGELSTKISGLVITERFFAFLMFFGGFMYMFSMSEKRAAGKKWGFTFIGGILMVLFGVFLLFDPLIGTAVMAWGAGVWCGVSLIMMGVLALAESLSFGKKEELEAETTATE